MSIILVILGFGLLVIGGEFLVRSSVALSFKFKVSKLVIGLTVVSFATSAPELFVCLKAALEGSPDLVLGNIIGSNIANIGLVLGITACITPLFISSDFFKLNWPTMMLMTFAICVFMLSGNALSRWEGLICFAAIILFLIMLIRRSQKDHLPLDDAVDDTLLSTSNFKIVVWLLIGAFALYFGSVWVVDGARDTATAFGVSERIISITMVAVGTSVPELAASVIAAVKQEKGISLGNLIGSNIFNIGSVLGLTAMIKPISVNDPGILSHDIFWMIGFAFILLPLVVLPKINSIGRYKGALILLGYIIFILLTIKSRG